MERLRLLKARNGSSTLRLESKLELKCSSSKQPTAASSPGRVERDLGCEPNEENAKQGVNIVFPFKIGAISKFCYLKLAAASATSTTTGTSSRIVQHVGKQGSTVVQSPVLCFRTCLLVIGVVLTFYAVRPPRGTARCCYARMGDCTGCIATFPPVSGRTHQRRNKRNRTATLVRESN